MSRQLGHLDVLRLGGGRIRGQGCFPGLGILRRLDMVHSAMLDEFAFRANFRQATLIDELDLGLGHGRKLIVRRAIRL